MSDANKKDVTHSLKDEHAPQAGNHDSTAQTLEALVEGSETSHEGHVGVNHPDAAAGLGQDAATTTAKASSSWSMSSLLGSLACKVLPSEKELDDDFARWKMGNYVAIRGTDETFFETMPLYVRVGMHLLFYGSKQTSILRWGTVENLLKKMSLREGVIYDDESDPKAVQAFIQNFIATYKIDTADLLESDLTRYKSRNSFFYRKLKDSARPIADPNDTNLISSAADCRLTVFETMAQARTIWVKGKKFSIHELVDEEANSPGTLSEESSLAIFRLAPADYHRYNHPVGPVQIINQKHAGKEFYTVNPDAVNEEFDVFTGNTRDVTILKWTPKEDAETYKVGFVSIGALLVGANRFTGTEKSKTYKRGEEMGYFAYGGSTVIAVFPPNAKVKWDDDLLRNSKKGLETLVRVGERIGTSQA